MLLCAVLLLRLSLPLPLPGGLPAGKHDTGGPALLSSPQGMVFGTASEGGCLDPTVAVQGGGSQPCSLVDPYLRQGWSCSVLRVTPSQLAQSHCCLSDFPCWLSLSPRLPWRSLLTLLRFPWQLGRFGSGTKLLENFESLSGAAVLQSWLWTPG